MKAEEAVRTHKKREVQWVTGSELCKCYGKLFKHPAVKVIIGVGGMDSLWLPLDSIPIEFFAKAGIEN